MSGSLTLDGGVDTSERLLASSTRLCGRTLTDMDRSGRACMICGVTEARRRVLAVLGGDALLGVSVNSETETICTSAVVEKDSRKMADTQSNSITLGRLGSKSNERGVRWRVVNRDAFDGVSAERLRHSCCPKHLANLEGRSIDFFDVVEFEVKTGKITLSLETTSQLFVVQTDKTFIPALASLEHRTVERAPLSKAPQ